MHPILISPMTLFRFMLTEIYAPPEERNKYYQYGADMPFNFDLVDYVRDFATCNATCIRDVIQNGYDKLPEGKWTNFVVIYSVSFYLVFLRLIEIVEWFYFLCSLSVCLSDIDKLHLEYRSI